MKKAPSFYKVMVFPVILLLLLASCASRKEITRTPEVLTQETAAEPAPAVIREPEYKSILLCDEKTEDFFNSSGIDVLPFGRVIFYDIDGDGLDEMIAGSKDGSLRLYRNSGFDSIPQWKLEPDYFEGVRAGAFSAPAAGDIDGDGKPEILLGTGGFSKDSGKVLFFKNYGTFERPSWNKMDIPEIDVGNDATPALLPGKEGNADLIVGNSSGELFLFRAVRSGKGVNFVEVPEFFKGLKLGMYAVPAVTYFKNRLVVIAGNSMGKLVLLERENNSRSSWTRTSLNVRSGSFAAPAFISSAQPGIRDLVISDGSGQLSYYINRKSNYRDWELKKDLFSGRILAGGASAPLVTEVDGQMFMVVGNINGEIRLFAKDPSPSGLPWKEKPGFFSNIKLPGFSRGIFTKWEGSYLMVTGQQDGIIRAFMNTGTLEKPDWSEKIQFFRGVTAAMHAAPFVFDLDGDGKWELIVGGFDGRVNAFRHETGKDGVPFWKRIENDFLAVKVDRFASPSLAKAEGKTYLFVGQQDGKVRLFAADPLRTGSPSVFQSEGYLDGVQMRRHSAPAAFEKTGLLEVSIGDYDGNLKCFLCRMEKKELARD
jgi:hypothetical protein